MTQKVLKVGDSAAVTIPKRSLEEFGLKIGDEITVEIDKRKRAMMVRPLERRSPRQRKIAELTLNFINRYRKDLEALARK